MTRCKRLSAQPCKTLLCRGANPMKRQLELLRSEPWDVLVILDACRWDVFEQVVGKGECVRSPANCTPAWCRAVLRLLQKRGAYYVTGNPVVNRTYGKGSMPLKSVWRDHWAHFGDECIPTVHPMSVTACAIEAARDVDTPLAVHYIQPHSPYIGTPPLAVARVGGGTAGLLAEMSKLARPDVAVKNGPLTWEDVRAAYIGNLRLAWGAVQALIEGLALAGRTDQRVVVTADHGEVIGERGRFGHEGHWTDEALYRVPWLECRAAASTASVKDRLEALGYV